MLFQLCVCVCMWCGRGVVWWCVCGVVVRVVRHAEKNREKNVCVAPNTPLCVDARVFPALALMKLRSPSFKS